jgi:hypothetical protein
VDIVMSNGEVATSLSDGSYFGEICLLTNARQATSFSQPAVTSYTGHMGLKVPKCESCQCWQIFGFF